MGTPGGRKLRPLALLCALLFVLWGAASAGSLVCQLLQLDELGWPDENADGEIWAWTWLYLSAAAGGCWVTLWGLLGLAWRPPLHLGALALVVAVGTEVAANQVLIDYLSGDWGDLVEGYLDRATLQQPGLSGDFETWAFFTALPFVTAPLPLLAYLVVLFSGAGRKRKAVPFAYPSQQYAQPYPPQQHAAPAYQPPQPYQQQYQAPPYQPQPHHYQPPQHRPPPQQHQPPPPAYRPPPATPPARVPWQDVPPVVRGRPTPPRAQPPDQKDTLPYQRPPDGS